MILENDLDESPKSAKRKIEENDKTENKSAPPKKVILNRHTSIELSIDNKELENEPEQKEEKKVIKLSSLSAKEVNIINLIFQSGLTDCFKRLEMRAKKFGVTVLSSDAKKLVRAERFGTNSPSSTVSSGNTVVCTFILIILTLSVV